MVLRRYLTVALALGVVVSGCATTKTQEPKLQPKSEEALKPISDRPVAKKTKPKPKPYEAPIESYELWPYTPSGYPTTFAKYGPRMAEVEAYSRKAAELAASNRQCKKVTSSQVSSYKGCVNNLHFWVDCDDDIKRFNFTEAELHANVAAVTQAEKAFSRM